MLGDGNMRTLKAGEIIQLERKGYYIVDRPLVSAAKPLVRRDLDPGPKHLPFWHFTEP